MAGDNERLWLEVALRDLTGAGKDSILRNFAEIKNATIEASRASGELGGGAAQADKLASSLGQVAKIAVGVFTGIKVAETIKGFAEFHLTTMDSVGGLRSLADRLTITTDQLQALQGAARNANVTNEELNKTVGTFNQNVGQANLGNKTAIETFEKLGIKIRDSHGVLRPMPDLLNETARALLLIENGSTRAALGAQLLGDKGARLNPLLRELTVPIGDLVDRGKSFGEIVDKDIVDKLDRAKNASEAANQQFKALYATAAAPLHAKGLEYIAGLTGDLTRRLREAQTEAGGLMAKMDKLFGGRGVNPMGLTPEQLSDVALGEARKRVAALEAERKKGGAAMEGRESMVDEDLSRARKKVADLEAADRALATAAQNAADMQRLLGNEGAPGANPFKTGGASNPDKPGGSGGDKRDRIQEALNQLKGEVAAAQAAYDQLSAGYNVPLEQLQREVDLRKKIADEIAKLGKYDPKDPRVAQIKDMVRAHEELETKIKARTKADTDAVEIERRMGNGQAFMRAETDRLNQALDTGRLSYEAYSAAMRDASDKALDMQLRLEGQKEGFEGLVAGMRFAQVQWERQNRSFEVGQRIFTQTTQLMSDALTQLVTKGQVDFNKLLGSFTSMLAQMATQAAASSLYKLGGSLLSSAIGSIFGSVGGGGTSPLIGSGTGMTYAGGGDPPIGVPSLVGEAGPEMFVPRVPGTIYNRQQMAGMGGDSVVIHQTNYFGSDVNRGTLATWAERVKADTITAVRSERSRGGMREF